MVALPFAFEQVEAWFPLSIMLSCASAVFFLFHFFVDWIFQMQKSSKTWQNRQMF